jgi:hypothetical protein
MRSKFLVSAAIASIGVCGVLVSFAPKADAAPAKKEVAAKSKEKDKDAAKPRELHADEKAMKKQTQWEDKVMGPDSTRPELDKIARARAINERAAQEKERQAALEPAPAPKAAPTPSKKNEVSLIEPEKNEPARAHEISPQLETAAAQKPVAAVKPADDKFIDKLLRDEDSPSKKRASSANDKELENLLAGAKEKPHKKGDSVDDLLKTADKGPAMPAPRAQSGGLPEWAKQPEIAPTPPPAPPPIAVKPASKKETSVIQVVQGAAGSGPSVVAPASPAPVAARAGRKTTKTSAPPVAWSDPFADKRPVASTQTPKKEPASHPSATGATSWSDPFASEPETRKTGRRSAPPAPATPTVAPKKAEPAARPAGNAGWKDPFTKAPAEPARDHVAMRELGKNESSKWDIASRRPARAVTSDSHPANGWGVIKKRAR